MSKFREAREEAVASARRRSRPSALQIAWLVVLLGFGAVLGWIALSSPESPTKASPESSPGPAQTATPTQNAPAQNAPVKTAPAAPAVKAAAKPVVEAAPLTPAPIAAFAEKTSGGILPKIASDGREPWQAYARPYEARSAKPRIAIVIADLGLGTLVTDAAIANLPPAMTLAFSPYGKALTEQTGKARKAGHEILLMLPMEPQDYPKNDPGPHSLLTSLSAADNITRLHWVMTRFPGYVGVVNEMGSRFTASEEAMTPVLKELKARGLLFMDARTSPYSVAGKMARSMRVPRAINNRYFDEDPQADQILTRLQEVENLARSYGAAAAIGRPYPVTLKTVAKWAATLEKRGFELVPLTAVVNRQPVP